MLVLVLVTSLALLPPAPSPLAAAVVSAVMFFSQEVQNHQEMLVPGMIFVIFVVSAVIFIIQAVAISAEH